MCTHFTPTRNAPWVKAHLGVDLPTQEYPSEVFPGYVAPIVVKSHKTARFACGVASFGLVPAWAKDRKIGRYTYNARAETVQEKASYKASWQNRRYALVLLDHFYEPSYATGKAQRWRIECSTKEPFGIAGLWDRWADPSSGDVLTSFTMLTVNADEHPVMRAFHKPGEEKRTPLVLAPDQFNAWLGADHDQAKAMLNGRSMPTLLAQHASNYS